MSESPVNKVAERIRKLLALSTSANANEAASAATQAARLMQEYKLTAADVEADDGSKVTELPLGADGFRASWKFALVTGVARAFFCEVIALRVGARRRVRIVGKKNDAEVAVGVHDYLVKEIERLADVDADTSTARRTVADGKISIRDWKEKFRQGAAQGVVDRLKLEMETFRASGEKAMVVVNRSKDELREYLKKKYGESRVVDAGMPKTDAGAEAFLRGYDKGRAIAVPRAGGAERFLTGEVRPPLPSPFDDDDDDDLDGGLFDYDDFGLGLYDDLSGLASDLERGSDLSRGRGGRDRFGRRPEDIDPLGSDVDPVERLRRSGWSGGSFDGPKKTKKT